jgi:hypothetical protein
MTAGLFRQLTRESVSEAIDKAVAERGEDWTYPGMGRDDWDERDEEKDEWLLISEGCRYFGTDGKTPRCIIGYVLTEHGLDLDTLRGLTGGQVEGVGIDGVLRMAPILTDDRALKDALQRAQSAQDIGKTWSEARATFQRFVNG